MVWDKTVARAHGKALQGRELDDTEMIEITAIGTALMMTAAGVAIAALALEGIRRMLGRALQSAVATS